MGAKSRTHWAYNDPAPEPLFSFDRDPFWVDLKRKASTAACEQCGANLLPGDWPFCGGDPARHR